ncbi:MAG TPA: hypothetical protein VMN03_03305 [Burkholderiales bacterium]|nr:hypothetical protein [Burkholderiales bacterium]
MHSGWRDVTADGVTVHGVKKQQHLRCVDNSPAGTSSRAKLGTKADAEAQIAFLQHASETVKAAARDGALAWEGLPGARQAGRAGL